MYFGETEGYARHARENDGGLRVVILLALLLCAVFFLAVGAYGMFAREGGMTEGNLPGAVLALREFVEENDAVAVFLGFSEDKVTETVGGASDPEAAERIQAAADAYIKEHQP